MARQWSAYIAGAAVALFAAAGAVAYAQPAPQAGSSSDGDRAAREADHDAAAPGHPDGEHHVMRHEERRVIIHKDGDGDFGPAHHHHMDMAEHLRTMLQLKPGQEAALQAYLTVVKAPEHEHEHMVMMSHDEESKKTTPERLADMEKRMADSQAQAHARIDATRKFYAQLEPSQKKVFDEMPMLMVGPIGPIGPMMLPGPMKIRFEHHMGDGPGDMRFHMEHGPTPPIPPVPPAPPAPPRS